MSEQLAGHVQAPARHRPRPAPAIRPRCRASPRVPRYRCRARPRGGRNARPPRPCARSAPAIAPRGSARTRRRDGFRPRRAAGAPAARVAPNGPASSSTEIRLATPMLSWVRSPSRRVTASASSISCAALGRSQSIARLAPLPSARCCCSSSSLRLAISPAPPYRRRASSTRPSIRRIVALCVSASAVTPGSFSAWPITSAVSRHVARTLDSRRRSAAPGRASC